MISLFVNTVCFWFFVGIILIKHENRIHFRNKSVGEYALDLSGMIFRGVMIPVFHFLIVHYLLESNFPSLQGMFDPNPWLIAVVSVLSFDYIAYSLGKFFFPLFAEKLSKQKRSV